MGVDELWKILDKYGCCHRIKRSNLYDVIKGDKPRANVAGDAYLTFHAHFSTVWAGHAMAGNFNFPEMLDKCAASIANLCEGFRVNQMDLLLCLDGEDTEIKLASKKRQEIRSKKHKQILNIYLQCKKLDPQDKEGLINRYSFLEDYMYILKTKISSHCSDSNPDTTMTTSTTMTTTTHNAQTNDDSGDGNSDKSLAELVAVLRNELIKYKFMPKRFVEELVNRLVSKSVKICYVPSISEGEKLCSILVNLGYCQAVYSGDNDSVVIGSRCIIRRFNKASPDIAEVYFYNDVLERMRMTDEQFVGMCISIGTDFNDGAPGLGKVKSEIVVRKKDFNLRCFDAGYFGRLKSDVCLKAFRISKEEMMNVMNTIVFL
jgi:hypothetical protein